MVSGVFYELLKKYHKFFKSKSCHFLSGFEMQRVAEARTVAAGLIHLCLTALAAVCSCAKQAQNAVTSKAKYLFLLTLNLIYATVVERVGFRTGACAFDPLP